MSGLLAFILAAMASAATLHPADVAPYDDAYSDGYCNAVGDEHLGWRIDEIPHTRSGFTCVWSIERNDPAAHREWCSDMGGVAFEHGERLACRAGYSWPKRDLSSPTGLTRQ